MFKALAIAGLLIGWVSLGEAKNCGPGVADCACGDTIVVNTTFGSTATYDCSETNADQALKIANNVTVDCSGSTVLGNMKAGSAGFRLGTGSFLIHCYGQYWQYGFQLGGHDSIVYYGGAWNLGDECVHFSTGSHHNLVDSVYCIAPKEALYLLSSYKNEVRNSFLQGNNGAYLHLGNTWGNYIHDNTLPGPGPNRVNFVGAGNNNLFHHNDYKGGIIKSTNSAYPNYIGPTPINATLNNQDGSLVTYKPAEFSAIYQRLIK